METENNQNFFHQEEEDYQVCELMTDSAVREKDEQPQYSIGLPQQSEINQRVPSIIKNLQQTQHKLNTRISYILGSFSCDLYEEEMKTIRTLGIIPEEMSQMESNRYLGKNLKMQQDDISTKFNTTLSNETIQKSLDNNFSSFPTLPQSQISEASMIFKLKKDSNPDKSFSLFRNYLLRNKLEITSDYFNTIIAQLKPRLNNLSGFIQSIKFIQDLNLCLCYIPVTKSLKLVLSSHPKNSSKISKHQNELKKHGNNFKQYLWQNNCIQVSQSQSIQLTFIKEKQSISQLKKLIKSIMKENNNEVGLQNCLVKILQLRELLMYQLQQKQAKFLQSNPLIEIQKKLLSELQFYQVYKNYYLKNEDKYQQRKKIILQKYDLNSLYQYLKIPQSQRVIDQDGDFPYDAAVQEMQNFLNDSFPHLSLSNIQRFYNTLILCKQSNTRTSISQSLEGQGELGLVILCMVQSKLKNTYYKIKFTEHYLRITDNRPYEDLCLNLALGMDYIESSWAIN